MKKRLQQLGVFYKTAVISVFIILVIFLLLLPLFWYNLMEYPLGLLLGGLFSSLVFFLEGLLEKQDLKNRSVKLAISINVIRFTLFGGILFLSAYLYYRLNIKLFNVFMVTGGYFIPIVIMCIVMIIGGKKIGF